MAKKKVVKIPRQTPLPGIGDKKIAAIENAALDYAEIRDQRQDLTNQEVDQTRAAARATSARIDHFIKTKGVE